ncbi:Pentatricopeptide repeat-containing protein, chloroplastic [Vitis vinifera]|uniref:Pentatricopeptide repeat-containing protein, chloroplastic n=1 Tax=Vitis vinifera TaxID=29760 RepID=A0A438E717_VITVI|nr:Pentatricopeptide repeat-containing protein, chloroplastic [Vitis vinifera]RVX04461.1 Pentatricopeptide repeat-containing protein, chloroplastic [Vitis vinifera]
MQRRNLLFFPRSITNTSLNFTSTASSPSASLLLDSYCETNPHVDLYSNNRAIDSLIKSGSLASALHLFEKMPIRDVVTWNLLINGYRQHELPKQAFQYYSEMVFQGIRESSSTFSSVLSVCSNAGLHQEAIQVHSRVIFLGFSSNLYVAGSLVDLYMQMGDCDTALRLFSNLPRRNLAICNLVLRGFCELSRSEWLFTMYSAMKEECVKPNGLTFCYLIRGCGNGRFCDEGKQLHCHAIKVGWVEANLFAANALVDFYCVCGNLIDAKKSFEAIRDEDVISWNSIVSVFAASGLLSDALELFARMQSWGKKPSIRSFVGFLNAAIGCDNIIFGKQIQSHVVKLGFAPGSVHVESALINMYGKCGDIKSSVSVFESVPERTLEICNSLMSSLLHCGIVEDVLELFGLMVDEGIGVDEVTLSTSLKASLVSAFGSLAYCRLLHCCAIKSGFEFDTAVSCSLIDAYSKYGHVELSHQIFEQLHSPNAICFTSIINGYARNGMGREGLEMLEIMAKQGLKPDRVTFLCALTGCSHSGLVEEGRSVFNSMKSIHGIHPDQQHYSCMVDLLGRAGLLDEAEGLLKHAPAKSDSVMWSSLLQSCRIHGDTIVGRRAAKVLMELESEDPATYLQASSFYSEIGELEISMQIREIAIARRMKREMGHSLIEVNSHS